MEWTSLDTFITVVFFGFAVFLVLGTIMDVLIRIFSNPQDRQNQSIGNSALIICQIFQKLKTLWTIKYEKQTIIITLGVKVMLSFSVYTNFKSIISTATGNCNC